ncbi:MAG: DUF4783 domain-containing protein [Cyclobacteriaceae bacterium]|jgi:hypothetical protein|nr:DUF4783 domain-containing protein [Cyclobacteriaceae bacterium]
MESRKWVFTLFLALSTQLVWAQAEIFSPIKDALKTGSAKEMVKHLNQSVDINLEGEINTYSKAQGEFVLRDFFKKYPVSDFTIEHTGSSKSGLQYAIGNYKSSNDQFNVLIRVKQSGSVYLIHEISFVKE